MLFLYLFVYHNEILWKYIINQTYGPLDLFEAFWSSYAPIHIYPSFSQHISLQFSIQNSAW